MAGTARCFVGLPLPGDWQQALERVASRLAARLASRISWTRPGNWHVTLKFLGEVEQARLPELGAALRGVDFASFALRLGGAGFFPPLTRGGPKALWTGLAAGGEECASLAARVDAALAALGFEPERRPLRAHVTLGRVKAPVADDDWELVGRELGRETFPAAGVSRFVLWRSVLGPQGPKYAALESFPARDHGGNPDGGTA